MGALKPKRHAFNNFPSANAIDLLAIKRRKLLRLNEGLRRQRFVAVV